jgi:hypothetical protein
MKDETRNYVDAWLCIDILQNEVGKRKVLMNRRSVWNVWQNIKSDLHCNVDYRDRYTTLIQNSLYCLYQLLGSV